MQFLSTINFLYFLIISYIESHIIVDILKHTNIKNAMIFDGMNVMDRVNLQKRLFKNGIAISNLKLEADVTLTNVAMSQTKAAVVLNTSYSGWFKVLETSDYEISFKHPFTWLIFSADLEATATVLSKYPIEVDSLVLIITPSDENVYQLYEAYNTGFYTRGSFVVNSVGNWNNSRLHMKESRRTNLTGVVLKCMVVVTQMLTNETLPAFLEESRPTGFDLLHKKKYFTLLKYLRDMYNFNYELKRTTSWGYLNETAGGAFDGMIGALQRREIDIGGSPVFFRAERFKVLDYYMETWRSKQCFIFRHPKRLGAFYTIFTRPLSNTVWCSTVVLLTLSTVMLGMLLKLNMLKTRGDDDDSSLSIAFLSIWSAVCQQGMTVQRNSSAVKLVIFSTFVFSLTLYQYYNAVVVSTLLREPPKNIRSLEDLLKSDLKTGVEDVLYNIDFFRHTTNPIAIQLYNEKVVTHNKRNFFKADYGMARVKQGGFAFHVDSSSGYRIMRRTFAEREVCEVQELPLFPPQNMVATVKKGSPYKGIFAYGLRKMSESGLMHRIKSVWDEPKPACVRTPDSSVLSVSVVEFSTPLLLLAVGVILALAVLAGETAVWRLERNNVVAFRH